MLCILWRFSELVHLDTDGTVVIKPHMTVIEWTLELRLWAEGDDDVLGIFIQEQGANLRVFRGVVSEDVVFEIVRLSHNSALLDLDSYHGQLIHMPGFALFHGSIHDGRKWVRNYDE
jgi:hypothetical protein